MDRKASSRTTKGRTALTVTRDPEKLLDVAQDLIKRKEFSIGEC
jgi:hypothetical protein